MTALVRRESKTQAQRVLQKDLFDLTTNDLKGFDVIVGAFGERTPETLSQHQIPLKHLTDILSGANVHLIVVGDAGSLYVDGALTKQRADSPDFPNTFKPLVTNMAKTLAELHKRTDVKWTHISPAADFQADGKCPGSYQLGGEKVPYNAASKSQISYADYVIVITVVEEAEHTDGASIQKRIFAVEK